MTHSTATAAIIQQQMMLAQMAAASRGNDDEDEEEYEEYEPSVAELQRMKRRAEQRLLRLRRQLEHWRGTPEGWLRPSGFWVKRIEGEIAETEQLIREIGEELPKAMMRAGPVHPQRRPEGKQVRTYWRRK